MGFTAKAKEKSSNNESWGMGFFFILFHSTIITTNNKQKPNLSSLKAINTLLRPSNSTHLFSKAQFIISICLLLIFITLLLFTISTFEPSNSVPHKSKLSFQQHALQKMGFLYRKSTKSMNDLIIAHVIESVTIQELKLFTRLILRSKITSKSDLLFIFPSKSIPFHNTITQENNSFLKILKRVNFLNSTSNFDPTHFLISTKNPNESPEPIWGRKKLSNSTESTRLSYGSVVGFYADELDPENSLTGFFLDHVPMSLRRWACYPMLLGRVKRNYKHVVLVDVKEMLLLGDPLSLVKNLSQDSVIISNVTQSNHRRKNLQEIHKKQAYPAIIMGGARGIRRLSNAMLIKIVRELMQHKKKNSVTESVVLSQLVGNKFILKNVELISSESIVQLSSLTELDKESGSSIISSFSMIRRGNSNVDINSVFKRYLCSFPLDSTAYSDC
ncbi:hypothetical protein K7X08_037369 [Anisodus acutangulus]|uniref:DUF7780 domain-containing protein n=1 Tax=Anisodus acutangulus TaxID=402998 RepID=A0A9Q1MWU4_9SOLA|nr:hypothetical protein K7X08_037369 [Anisodus acutangulus]